MPDYQRTVEYLRDLRQGPLQSVTDEITTAATEYAALCVQANDRLRKCTSLLQQGLRTEALHLADESPNLLDLVAALDLPDPAAWADFCQNNGLPVPPPLQLDRASQLNDAYAQDQPLEHLLTQHRYLALSRGPIGERLAILRKIASIDAASTAWEKDIRVFEKARIKELPAAFLSAVRTKDEPAIASLNNEVNQSPWFEPVPADLSTAVADAFTRMQRATVEVELRKMVEPLREAFAAQSVQECKALVQRWKNTMASSGVTSISPELTDEIRPVIAYVAQEDKRAEFLRKFRDSCKAFGRLLDMNVPEAQLEIGYSRLKEFNEPIPQDLTDRYAAKNKSRQQVIDRSHRTRLIGIGASAAAVAIVVLVVYIFVARAADARQWAAKIDALAAGKNLSNLQLAQQYVADLKKNHPSLLSEAPLARAVRDTDAKQGDYDRDANTVQELLTKFDAAAKNAGAVNDNKDASLDQLLAAATGINDALAQSTAAGDIAWADTSDKKFDAGTHHLQDLLASLHTRAATAVHSELDAAAAKVEAIGPTPANMSEASDQLGAISSRLRTLVSLSGLDDDSKRAVAALAQSVDKRRDSLNAASTVAGELENVRHNASTADDLKKSLTGYLARFPTDPRAADFTESLNRIPLDKDIEAWRELTSPWSGQFVPGNAAAAQKRIDALAAYLAAHPSSPMTATANTYTDYLKRETDALAEKGTWQQAFGDLFANPLLTDLAYMETSDGQRFYVLGDIKRTDRRINSQISITFEALNPTDPSKRMLVAVDPPATLATKDPIPVPHAKLVGELNDQLKTIDSANFDTWGIDTVDRLVKNKQINIVVKAILVGQALRTENAVADWAIGDTYTQAITELSRQKPENLSLLDSTRVSAGTVKSLQTTLDSIPSAAAMKEKLATAKTTLFKSVAFDVTGTAVLLKDDAGNYSVGSKTLATDGNLWTPLPAPAGATPPAPAPAPTTEASSEPAPAAPAGPPATLIQIGTVTAGKFALYDNAIHDLPQGAMIFITQP